MFFKLLDGLPQTTEWIYDPWEIEGNIPDQVAGEMKCETIELWRRNPVTCIKELLSNPIFKEHLHYAPERHYVEEGGERLFSEAWTGNRMWQIQDALPPGATVVLVNASSDKLNLTHYSGDKVAWPIYITIANISKDVRRQISKHAMILIGYLPTTKLQCFKEDCRSAEIYKMFHKCLERIFQPMIEAGQNGVRIICADGGERHVYPVLTSYIADHPEQCLVSGCKENFCPKCIVKPSNSGDGVTVPYRSPGLIASLLDYQPWLFRRTSTPSTTNRLVDRWEMLGLRELQPFWRLLPHCNIFMGLTPDILHQLHKGMFKDHTVAWTTRSILGDTERAKERELDARFRSMPSHPDARHFKKGISSVSQWTGTEYKNMEKVFLGAIAGAVDTNVIRPVRAVIDFIYYAHFAVHTESTLQCMRDVLKTFHETKAVFINNGSRNSDHFNIPKLHSQIHYVEAIQAFGTADAYNSEMPERKHITVKTAYQATNKKDTIKQMVTSLAREEAIIAHDAYIAWAEHGGTVMEKDTPLDGADNDGDGQSDVEEEEDGDEEEVENTNLGGVECCVPAGQDPAGTRARSYKVAKRYISTPFADLQAQVGSSWLGWCIDQFLQHTRRLKPTTVVSLEESRTLLDSQGLRVGVFKRVRITLPAIKHVSMKNIEISIRATPFVAAQGQRREIPARFDTVLADVYPPPRDNQPSTLEIHLPISCPEFVSQGPKPCVARVKGIFRLPAGFGEVSNEILAFVEWFSPDGYDKELGMEKVKPVFKTYMDKTYRHASIIPVTNILRSCHISPVCGKNINPAWTSENVLDQAKRFYVNPYITHMDFVLHRVVNESL